jgi:hypothetical protein
MKVAVSGIAVAAALTAAAGAAGSQHARPQPIAFTCKFEKGIAVLVEPRRRQTTIVDAGVTGDQYGNRIQSPESNRVVAIFNSRGPSFFVGCKRVTPARRARVSHLTGPWPARVFSRVLCPAGGPAVRFDAFPVAGGGYRLSISLRSGRGIQNALVSTEQRPRNRGGISFDTEMCFRLGK